MFTSSDETEFHKDRKKHLDSCALLQPNNTNSQTANYRQKMNSLNTCKKRAVEELNYEEIAATGTKKSCRWWWWRGGLGSKGDEGK